MKPIKGFLPLPCNSIPRKKESSSSHSLSLSFTFSILLFDSFFHIIYQSKIYFISTTLIYIIFVLVLQHNNNFKNECDDCVKGKKEFKGKVACV